MGEHPFLFIIPQSFAYVKEKTPQLALWGDPGKERNEKGMGGCVSRPASMD